MSSQLRSLTALTSNQATPIAWKLDQPFQVLEAFSKFQEFPYPALLDSSLGPIKLARYSYFTADPFLILRSNGRDIHIETKGGKTIHLESNPFTVLQNLLDRHQLQKLPGLPPFQGGAVGYFSYELAHHIENLPDKANKVIGFISQHSLGIYILHPIFLWPMKEYGWYQGHPAWVIPVWIVLSGSGALVMSWMVSKSRRTRWLLP